MSDSLAGCCDVGLGEEQSAKPDLDIGEVVHFGEVVELCQATGEIGDPLRNGHRFLDLVAPPMIRDRAFGQRTHQRAEVVGLFESSFADLDDIDEIFPNGAQ